MLHVFRSFRRTGSSTLTGSDRQEHYEVVLEDWLLENLNQRYVIPEDFNAYKQLTRPTAKGIFGNLHLWFHASQGRPVEKDYTELCNLLNVQAYPHLSKIKTTMGHALNELVSIHYLSRWDIQKMTSKVGYKIIMTPGEELMMVIQDSRSERRPGSPALPVGTAAMPATAVDLAQPPAAPSENHQHAMALLKRYGVVPAKAVGLIGTYGCDVVIDTVEYLAAQVIGSKRSKVGNPAGLIVYSLENALPVPAGFVGSRRKKSASSLNSAAEQESIFRETEYMMWVEQQQDRAVREQYSETELRSKLLEIAQGLAAKDDRVRRMSEKAKRDVAYRILCREVATEVELPGFDQWCAMTEQMKLL